jgi:hypothetical protein
VVARPSAAVADTQALDKTANKKLASEKIAAERTVSEESALPANASSGQAVNDQVHRAIESMRSAHRAEATSGRTGHTALPAGNDPANDTTAIARAKQIDQEFADAALKAHAAILAARSAHTAPT